MSKKKYVKPEIEVIKFNNGDKTNNNTYLNLASALNHNNGNMSFLEDGKTSITVHSGKIF